MQSSPPPKAGKKAGSRARQAALAVTLALLLFVTNRVDATYVAAAWAFVVFRVAHSVVHCTFNRVMVRFSCYLAASLALWFMLLRAGAGYLAQ